MLYDFHSQSLPLIFSVSLAGVILGVTGNGHQPEIDLFMHSGANRILIKPLSADQFYDILLGKRTVISF